MNRFVTFLILAVMAIGTCCDVSAAPARRKKRAAKPRVTSTFKELPDPLADPANAVNQGQEPLASFIDLWKQSADFRAERSKGSTNGYYDEENGKVEKFDVYDPQYTAFELYCSGIPDADWQSYFKPGVTVTKERRTTTTDTREWNIINPNLALFNFSSEYEDEYDGGGGAMTFIFERIDGKWMLTAIMAAG